MSPKPPSIAAIIPALDQHAMTRRCVESLRATAGCELRIVLVDDGSLEPYAATDFPDTAIVRHDSPRGYTQATNRGIARALGDFWPDALLLVNNDIEFRPGALARMISGLERFDIVGPWGRFVPEQNAALHQSGLFIAHHPEQPTPFLEFCCVLVRRTVFEQVGLLDARFEQGYYTDDDFCLRSRLASLRLGQLAQTLPPDLLHHVGGTHGSARAQRIADAFALFTEKWSARTESTVRDYIRDYLWDPRLGSFGKMREAAATRRATNG